MTPAISVIMPAYNAERYIADALRSLQSQSFTAIEIIVVSDGSTDRTVEIVEALAEADERIRLFVEPHRGVAATRNTGIAAATGDFVAFLDSDDLCPAGRFEQHFRLMMANETISAIIGDMMIFDIAGPDGRPAPDSRTMQLQGASLTATMFRRSTFAAIGHCDEELMHCEGLDLLMRLWESGIRVMFDDEVAVYYRWHETNMTHDRDAAGRYFLMVLHRSLLRRRSESRTTAMPAFSRRRDAEAAFDRR